MAGWAIRAGGLGQVAAALIMAIAAIPGAAHAEGRVALVVGNAAYTTGVGPLANPVKDAALIADALAARQFAVTRAVNLDRVQLLAAVDAYARKLAAAGPGAVGFVYYSGHGAANPDNGRNYLIPVDARSAADSTLWYQSVPLQEIVETISKIAPQAANIVVFDACREALRLPGGKGLGDSGKGLHREEARPSVLIAFSTSPDAIAADLDRSAATGPYATELAAALAKPGVDLEAMFSDVKYGVLSRTGDKQLPYIENGLRARVVLGGVAQVVTQPPAAATQLVPAARPLATATTDLYAPWGLTARDFGTTDGKALLQRAGASTRFADILRAAQDGSPVAQTLAGMAFDFGVGTGQDYSEAMRWYRKAADLGEALAITNIGVLYDAGQGVPQDFVEAMRWYREAADLGQPRAMTNIGALYHSGQGVPRDYAEAMRWYRKSADLGEHFAMTIIGVLFENGQGVPKDFAEARRWYEKAAALGDDLAKQGLRRLKAGGH